MNLPKTIKDKLRALPNKPGCYIMRDRHGQIIYVGKAVSLKKRVQSYFRNASLRSASPKDRSLIKSINDIDHIVVRNEAEALLTEGKLIKEYKPRYNVSFRDDKRFLLLNTDPNQPFPTLKPCRIRRNDNTLYFGPYASSTSARTALDFVEKTFGLRKCSPRLPNQKTHAHCINDIVRYCSAPCMGNVTRKKYHELLAEACAFLGGKRPEYLNALAEEMQTASKNLDYEKATSIRDTLFLIREAVKQNIRIRSTPAMKKESAETGMKQLKHILRLKKTPRSIEAYDISNISGTYAVAGMVCFVNGVSRKNRYRRFKIKTAKTNDDPAMIAEVVRRRFSDPEARHPDLILIDGGITQLKAARKELSALNLRVPSAGLAKRYEELYQQETGRPLRLASDSPALKLLQQLRDEAHRFAITYHRNIRSIRIRESLLDEIPGIGEKRKLQLLARFGTVRRVAKATEEELSDIPGFNRKIAETIKKHLNPFVSRVQANQGQGIENEAV